MKRKWIICLPLELVDKQMANSVLSKFDDAVLEAENQDYIKTT